MTRFKYDHFKQTCQAYKLKPTAQRFIIFKTLLERGNHPTADCLFEQVSQELPGIGRDTVYRTLNSLAELGLARKLTMPGGATHFDGDVSSHHHFLCRGCGRIFDFKWPEFNQLPWPAAAVQLGSPRDASVLITGVCRHCVVNETPSF